MLSRKQAVVMAVAILAEVLVSVVRASEVAACGAVAVVAIAGVVECSHVCGNVFIGDFKARSVLSQRNIVGAAECARAWR